ncbi:hypothetical protein EMCRGX_G034540 [Ephydatia muelleri]
MAESSEKVLVENDGVFELVNASEVLCLDSSGDLDATTQLKANIASISELKLEGPPTESDVKLKYCFQPPSEAKPARMDLNQDSLLPLREAGPVQIDLKPKDSLREARPAQISSQPSSEAGPAQISSQPPNEAGPAHIDLNLDCSETGSIKKMKKGVSSNYNFQDTKHEPTIIQSGIATHERQRTLLQNKPPLGLAGAEDVGRRKLNDAAFFVWLASKKELQASKQKAVKNAERASREESERRARQSKVAFELWLAQKNQQDTAKEKKPTAVSRSGHQSFGPSAFEMWVRKKREEHVKKVQIENKRLELEEEAAKRVDHNIANKAFSRWLHHKTIEAKKAPEQHRRLCSQKPRTLKNISFTRFEGF